jgi:transcription antitermination factor NusG
MSAVEEIGLCWYAIRTRPRHEKVVRDQLAGRGIEPLLPTFVRISQWKDRRKTIQLPLFPGYCFAKFSLDGSFPVLQATGVIDIVGQGHGPEPIPEEDIDAVKMIVLHARQYDRCSYLADGTRVTVIRGPLKGVHGTLVRRANRDRLVVAVHMIRQAVSVEIDALDVEPVVNSFC